MEQFFKRIRSLNYGAVLQAYGLVKSIEKLGYKCEIIDYRNNELENRDSVKRFIKTKGVMRNIYQYLEMPFWFIRRKRFNDFLNLVNVSNTIFQINKDIEDKYYKCFVGSDQVWNYRVTKFDSNYFFNKFEEVNKINSYAASFGIDNIPREFKDNYIKYLKRFSSISVREEVGANIVESLIEKRPKVVIDPSLLLDKKEWGKLINKPVTKGKYILIYQRAYSETLIKFAERLSKITGYKIVTINGNPRQPIKAKYVLNAGPIEWLSLIMNAEFVVTNSFHGVAFSINFEKKFYVELLDSKFGVNSRLENIIEKFGLEERQIKEGNDINIDDEINYININNKLSLEREKSIKYLKDALDFRGK